MDSRFEEDTSHGDVEAQVHGMEQDAGEQDAAPAGGEKILDAGGGVEEIRETEEVQQIDGVESLFGDDGTPREEGEVHGTGGEGAVTGGGQELDVGVGVGQTEQVEGVGCLFGDDDMPHGEVGISGRSQDAATTSGQLGAGSEMEPTEQIETLGSEIGDDWMMPGGFDNLPPLPGMAPMRQSTTPPSTTTNNITQNILPRLQGMTPMPQSIAPSSMSMFHVPQNNIASFTPTNAISNRRSSMPTCNMAQGTLPTLARMTPMTPIPQIAARSFAPVNGMAQSGVSLVPPINVMPGSTTPSLALTGITPQITTGSLGQYFNPLQTQPTPFQTRWNVSTSQSVRMLPLGLVVRRVYTTVVDLLPETLACIVYDVAARNEYPAELVRGHYNPFKIRDGRMVVKEIVEIYAEIQAGGPESLWTQILRLWAHGLWP